MSPTKFQTYQLYKPEYKYADPYGIMKEAVPMGDMVPCKEFIKARTQKEAESRMIKRLHSLDIRFGVFEMRLIGRV